MREEEEEEDEEDGKAKRRCAGEGGEGSDEIDEEKEEQEEEEEEEEEEGGRSDDRGLLFAQTHPYTHTQSIKARRHEGVGTPRSLSRKPTNPATGMISAHRWSSGGELLFVTHNAHACRHDGDGHASSRSLRLPHPLLHGHASQQAGKARKEGRKEGKKERVTRSPAVATQWTDRTPSVRLSVWLIFDPFPFFGRNPHQGCFPPSRLLCPAGCFIPSFTAPSCHSPPIRYSRSHTPHSPPSMNTIGFQAGSPFLGHHWRPLSTPVRTTEPITRFITSQADSHALSFTVCHV